MSSSIPDTRHDADASAEVLLRLDDAGSATVTGERVKHRRAGLQPLKSPFRPLIFRNVNLTVRRGEVLAILGRNGVGKSTR